MVLWRISRHVDLKGAGGLRASGRWHRAGHRIVYLAESPAAALLEVCVHTSASDVPPDFTMLRIDGPQSLEIPSVADIPEDWAVRLDLTQSIGTAWLERGDELMLRVPSVLAPETWNVLFNPNHPNASDVHIVGTFTYPFDPRLKL
jgi:RES domain-containing protein